MNNPRNRHWILAVAAVVCLLTVSGGCGRDKGRGTGARLVVGVLNEPRSLNPLLATATEAQDIINLMFIRLAREQGDFLGLEPQLAESWTFSDDSLSVTFKLRKNVKWHDGVPVTANDVRFTWRIQTNDEVGWFGRRLKDRISNVVVVDDYTVRFEFRNRYLYQLHDAVDGVILPQHILRTLVPDSLPTAAFSRHPVGAGPYRFADWVPGQYIELEANPDFYIEGEPSISNVAFRFVPDQTNLLTQLKTGEIDVLESVPIEALDEIREKYNHIRIYSFLSRGMSFVIWNLEDPLFKDRRVRRALAQAINVPEIITALWGGMAEVSDSPMHPLLWAHDPSMTPIAFDPDAARARLAELGWRDTDKDGVLDKEGKPFEFEMTTNQGIQMRADVMTMVQEYLRRVGIKVNARVLEWNTFIGGVVKGNFQSAVLGWNVETRADLTSFWHSSSIAPAGFNACRYKNAEVDSLIERARNTTDLEQARKLWYRCQHIIYEDQPILFLAVPYEVVGVHDNFCDVDPNVHGVLWNLQNWHSGADCR